MSIIILGTEKSVSGFDKDIPIVGKEYNCYDDGKIRPSRHYRIKVEEVIPFDDVDKNSDLFKLWEYEVEQCYWLFKEETDYFIKSSIEDEDECEYFVRTICNGWFSLAHFLGGGLLDYDNSRTESLKEYFPKQYEIISSGGYIE